MLILPIGCLNRRSTLTNVVSGKALQIFSEIQMLMFYTMHPSLSDPVHFTVKDLTCPSRLKWSSRKYLAFLNNWKKALASTILVLELCVCREVEARGCDRLLPDRILGCRRESGIEFQGAAEKEVDTFGEIEEEEEEGGSKCCIDDNFLRWNVQYGPH
eukprot:scaffold10667_cov132-Skeletonema_marinoi.AAC.1